MPGAAPPRWRAVWRCRRRRWPIGCARCAGARRRSSGRGPGRTESSAGRECPAAGGQRDPKKSRGVLCQAVTVKYAWIEAQRARYPVGRLCRLLGVSRSGFYAWRGRTPCRRSRSDARLVVELRARFARHRGQYGRPRLTADLRAAGFPVNPKRVRRLMLREGLHARRPRRLVRTTDSRHGLATAPNVLDRHFAAEAPNPVWLADITYVGTDEGWLYVALVLDLFSRD